MWTISNSRGDRLRASLACACLCSAALAASCQRPSRVPPDAPRQAVAAPQERPPAIDSSEMAGTLEIRSVRVRRLDPTLEKMAGPPFLKQASEPLAIEVVTRKPLPKIPRSTSAIIIWNGEKFPDTWMILPDKLVAFLPDRRKIKEENKVAAAWIGTEQASMSREPLTFRAADVGK